MLSSVLNSRRAVQVNIEIMRAFVRLRQIMSTHKDLARKLEALEKKYDAQFKVIFDTIRKLMTPPEPSKRRIGFIVKERGAKYERSEINPRHQESRSRPSSSTFANTSHDHGLFPVPSASRLEPHAYPLLDSSPLAVQERLSTLSGLSPFIPGSGLVERVWPLV